MIGPCIWFVVVLTGLACFGAIVSVAGRHHRMSNDGGWERRYTYAIAIVSMLIAVYYALTGLCHIVTSCCRSISRSSRGVTMGYRSSVIAVVSLVLTGLWAVSVWWVFRDGVPVPWSTKCGGGDSQASSLCSWTKVVEFFVPAALAGWALVFVLSVCAGRKHGIHRSAFGKQ